MSSTPEQEAKAPSTSLGWTQTLFGFMSAKKTSRVDSSTGSTSTNSKKAPPGSSPKPFQNLVGFNTIHSPQQVDSKAFSATNGDTGMNAATSAFPMQKLQETTSPSVPSKSPWKAFPNDATNGPRFSVGKLKPQSSQVGTWRGNIGIHTISGSSTIRPVDKVRRRKNKYRRNGVFAVQRSKRGQMPNFDKVEMNKTLLNARSAIEAPREKIEYDKNFRTAFDKRTWRPGTRLYPSNKAPTNGRLPIQRPSGEESTKFVTNGKRRSERDDDEKPPSMRKKRRAHFGDEENANHAPIENLVATPKVAVSKSAKRKATPYTKASHLEGVSGGNKVEDEKKASVSDRKIHKIKRSPSSKQKPSKIERLEDFPVMLSTNVIMSDFTSWSTPEQRENSTPIRSNRIFPKNYLDTDLPQMIGADLSNQMSKRLPQFQQEPLFKGKKKDRTVGADDDDDDDDDVVQRLKKSRDKWNCEKCGLDNDDDETYCQQYIKDEKGKPKKCGVNRSSKIIAGWGNTFEKFTFGKIRCEKCRTLNDIKNKKCCSCEAPLPQANDSTTETNSQAKTIESKGSEGSIGKQGFSFGGGTPAGKLSSSGFSFGGKAVTDTASPPATTGFQFGVPTPSGSSSTNSSAGFKISASTTSASSSTDSGAGFKFGASTTSASSSTDSGSGFKFGASTTPASSSTNSGAGFKFGGKSPSATKASATSGASSSGGFQFGKTGKPKSPLSETKVPPKVSGASAPFQFGASTTKSPLETAKSSAATTPKFQFSVPTKGKSPLAETTAVTNSSSTLPSSKAAPKPFSFGASNAAAPAPSPNIAEKAATHKPSIDSNSGAKLFGNFAKSFGSSAAQTPKFSFGTNKDASSTSKQVSEKAPTAEPESKRKSEVADSKSAFSISSTTTTEKASNQGAPAFSFGSSSTDASKSATAPTQGFSFGGSSAATSTAPVESSIAKDDGLSSGRISGALRPLGSVATEGNDDGASKKKRRSRDDAFGTKTPNEAPTAMASSNAQAGAPAPFVFGKPSTNSSKEGAPSFGNASNNSISASGATGPAPSFGSTPTPAASLNFGSTPAPAAASNPAAPSFTFGSTLAPAPASTPTAPSFTFGSTPAPAPAPTPAAPFTFGSTPAVPAAPAPTPAAPFTFGATTAKAPNASTFGSTSPAPAATMTFGSTPAPGPGSGFGSAPSAPSAPFGASAPMQFGTPAPAAASVPFGSAAPTQPFGNTFNNAGTTFGSAQPTTIAAPMNFGGAAPPAQNPAPGGFGSSGFGQQPPQQPPSATPNAGFSLGTAPRGRTPGRGRRILRARRPTPR